MSSLHGNGHGPSLFSREQWSSSSKRWSRKAASTEQKTLDHMHGLLQQLNQREPLMRRRVMVVVDSSSSSRHAVMWALTHIANKGDLVTLFQVIEPGHRAASTEVPSDLARSLGALCKACKSEVDVEALVIQGPRSSTVISQVKKLEASVLVLGQKKPSPLGWNSHEEFVDQCINNTDCLTLAVRKQSKGIGGYLITSRWQKNFWLLA
ncbi:hypothetical protein AMTR_s00070p00184710 [Amborella trichopoda]|uniref:UspA domain-containing protein n=1 Tax=Amborella trichopoda TaxID=13333 RepID=U5DEN0_AMBTC|nr:hypothetical protein AMTR_s00070p00184710 [Amborella trichopoda]